MKKLLFALSLLAGLGLVASPAAFARTKAPAKKGYVKKKAIVFKTPEQILAGLPRPKGDVVTASTHRDLGSLIEYRVHWNDKMHRLMDEL